MATGLSLSPGNPYGVPRTTGTGDRRGRNEREVRVRGRLCLIGAGVLMLTGCGGEDASPTRVAVPAPPVVELPASTAGGACELLDYPTVEQDLGIRFDVAAASRLKQTYTCVFRTEAAHQPDLTLSVIDISMDAAGFKTDLVPGGGRSVSGLGKAAYQLTAAPADEHGATAEIGWLGTDGRAASLRYTLPTGQGRDAAEELVAGLVALAKKIDTSNL
ncbi:hypothetical protein GCM10027280_03830 [Micromonospora polyrhachis]|uniref:DUF3558 domain-containing protein n=1 Tax=Micromonospora polyrhachis TaxID=1282883 RepID=A0A7W7WN70_9ACTN|nr:hypothetical protein [Micromonospora polyrhachis]MBB4957317.1 hypothetical protein [Micromonospora polyrhachis]